MDHDLGAGLRTKRGRSVTVDYGCLWAEACTFLRALNHLAPGEKWLPREGKGGC